MKMLRSTKLGALLFTALFVGATRLSAQGVTTGAVSGTVSAEENKGLAGAQVQVVNKQTGARTGTLTRADGRYYVPGLEVGGPYTVTVRRIGYAPIDSNNVFISLGQTVRVDFALHAQAAQLGNVVITATTPSAVFSQSHTGPATTITDSAIARLPSLNRNFTDIITATPQITTKGPGNSGGGANNRYNAIQIDGAVAEDLFGLGSTGQPGGQASAKQVPLGAVKEYQVLLAPFDVRQGNFTGALVNAVTKSGTNELHGEVLGVYRDEKMERNVPYLRSAPFTQSQSGFTVGGPIIQDKLHYLVSAELQNKGTPASGPYFGQPDNSPIAVPVSASDFARLGQVLSSQYGYPAGALGDSGKITDKNPLANAFARFDFENLPHNSRLVARYNYANGKIDAFPVSSSACNRSSNSYCGFNSGYTFNSSTNSELAQLFTGFNNGSTNEALLGYTTIRDIRDVPINAPFVQVKAFNQPSSNTLVTTLSAGTDNSSQGNALDQDILELTDNYTIPISSHRITIGTKNTFYKVRNLFSQNSLGFYTFGNIDSLILGLPDRVQIGKKLDNSDGAAHFFAHTYGAYIQDEWQLSENFNLSLGLRADMPGLNSAPGTNVNVDTLLHINTANVPRTQIQWGPRMGFNWDITGDQSNQLRGGSGIFVGQPAWVWVSNVFGNSGVNGYATFTCTSPSTAPHFPGATGPVPTACAAGATNTPVTVNTIDPNLKFPAAWRSALGYDRRLPWNMVGTIEGLYSLWVDQFYYQNIGLQDNPIGTDGHGRELYGNLTGTTGQFTTLTTQYKPGLSDVISLTNQTKKKDYSYSVTGSLSKRFSNNFEGEAAYTYSRSYNQYDLTSSVAYSNWQFGRAYAGRTDDQSLAPSKWDAPHRIILSGTYTFKTHTDVSLIMDAESGVPYTWVVSGDLNGDGSGNNDPMYIPTNSHDPGQITFVQNGNLTPAAQQDSMEAFINRNPCVAAQRGQIMARNSCRFPWTRFLDFSARQSLHTLGMQHVILQIDAFNVLNLINKNWGAYPSGASTNDPFILIRQTFVGGNDLRTGAQAAFRYSPNFNLTTTQNASSNYRLQAQLKYTF